MRTTRLTTSRQKTVWIALILGGASVEPVALGGGVASFTPMGDLPGGMYASIPMSISADGSKVVGISLDAAGNQAVSWTSTGGLRTLGDLPGGNTDSRAYSVSGNGAVIVGHSYAAQGIRAFRWTELTGMVQLGNPPPGHDSYAQAVSTDGVYAFGDSGSSVSRAVRWDPNGVVRELGELPGGSVGSGATACSADGRYAAGVSISSNGDEAFRWSIEGGMVPLGDLPGGGFESRPWGMSADGAVVIGQGRSTLGQEAFRWTSAGGMVGLGDLPGGDVASVAKAVSADGSIVVGWGEEAGDRGAAFVWDEIHGMRRIRDVLVALGLGAQIQGWRLNAAVGISADGTTIVGTGYNPNNQDEGWVVTIPEPSTLVLILLIPCTFRCRRS